MFEERMSMIAQAGWLPQLINMLSWWQWAMLAAVPPAIVLLYFLKLLPQLCVLICHCCH